MALSTGRDKRFSMDAAGTYELKYKNYNHEHNFIVLYASSHSDHWMKLVLTPSKACNSTEPASPFQCISYLPQFVAHLFTS